MGLPTALTSQAYGIVDKALSTGARGHTEKTTDYSALSDGFFKKAQLDAQIGGMLMDQQFKRASLMGELEMHKADLHMQAADMALRDAHFQQARKDQKDADKMSPFEQITGVLGGAAMGAVTGQMVAPGPAGAIGGGVLGGVMALGAGNSRRAQSNTLSNIGAISNAAVMFKGVSNQQKSKDAGLEVVKGLGAITANLRKEPGSPQQVQAQADLDARIERFQTAQLEAGVPMQQVMEQADTVRKMAYSGYDPTNPKHVATRQMDLLTAAAKADPEFLAGNREVVNKFQSEMGAAYIRGYGKAPNAEMRQAWVGAVDAGVAQDHFSGGGSPAVKAASSAPARTIDAMPSGNNTSDPGVASSGRPFVSNYDGSTVARGEYTEAPPVGIGLPQVPGAGGNTAVGQVQAEKMFGVELDNQEALMDSITDQSKLIAENPKLVDKAMNRTPSEVREREIQKQIDKGYSPEEAEKIVDSSLDSDFKKAKPPGLEERMATSLRKIDAFGIGEKLTDESRIMELREERGAINNPTTARDWKAEVAQMPTEDQPAFTEMRDPRKLNKIYGLDKKRFDSPEEKKQAAGTTTTFVKMNQITDKLGQMKGKVGHQIMKDYHFWKESIYGEEGMKASSVQLGGIAFGLGWSNFEKSERMRLEGMGFSGEAVDEQIQILREIDAQVEPLAMQLAVATQGSKPTDKDVAIFKVVNLMDPNPDNSIVGIRAQQRDLLTALYSITDLTPDRDEYNRRKAIESRAGRMTPDEYRARRQDDGASGIFQ